jgi:hypothetical protein
VAPLFPRSTLDSRLCRRVSEASLNEFFFGALTQLAAGFWTVSAFEADDAVTRFGDLLQKA